MKPLDLVFSVKVNLLMTPVINMLMFLIKRRSCNNKVDVLFVYKLVTCINSLQVLH